MRNSECHASDLARQALIGADWHVHTAGPNRRCLECWKAFDPSLVGAEMAGKLDDPSYLAQLDPTPFSALSKNYAYSRERRATSGIDAGQESFNYIRFCTPLISQQVQQLEPPKSNQL